MSEMLKVSSSSEPSATAGALANTIREDGEAELQAIGPKAVNQAIKSITIARGYMAPSGVDLIFIPSFVDVEINGEKKTAMRMKVITRLPYQTRGSDKSQEQSKEDQTQRNESSGKEDKEQNEENDNGSKNILDF